MPNVAFSCRRACGRLGTCLCFFPLNGSPLASVIGQLQRLVGCSLFYCSTDDIHSKTIIDDAERSKGATIKYLVFFVIEVRMKYVIVKATMDGAMP